MTTQTAEPGAILGYWQIEAWEQRYDDGRVKFPMGEALDGFIRYDADGRMACMIARRDRARLSGGQFTSPDGEKIAAYDGFFAYAGTYTLEGGRVVHHVAMSLFPNWEGGDQPRRFALAEDGRLHITARLEEGTSEARTAALIWSRP